MEEKRAPVRLGFWPLIAAAMLGVTAGLMVKGEFGSARAPRRPAPPLVDTAPASAVAADQTAPPDQATPAGQAAPPGNQASHTNSVEAAPLSKSDEIPAPLPGGKLRFREIWAYLMPGEESLWLEGTPITDLGLFDFSLDPTGRLTGKANSAAIQRARREGVRTHLVVASSGNKSLLHLALSPRYGVRPALLAEIAQLPARHPVDGVQLDLEGPRPEERADLVSFVRELRAALPEGRRLSLALPAKIADSLGAYVYADLAELADRLFIMVYDQHWKGGPPGAISALSWHDRVLACARAHLPPERVVVGLPFYGRVWQREAVARALKYPEARDLASHTAAQVRHDPAESHSFTFRTEVTAECWFEDAGSLRTKLESARAAGFQSVGFWRLGQEDPRIWEIIERE